MDHRLLDDDDEYARKDRELTLSTGAILGLFFGLVLICGLFFGLGYNLGSHKSAAANAAAALPTTSTAETTPAADFNSFKPSAGSPSPDQPKPIPPPAATPPATSTAANTPSPVKPSASEPGVTPSQKAESEPLPSHAAASTPAPAHTTSTPAASATGTFIVQIAAVSHQEDADLLMTALKNRGYHPFAHTGTQDTLIHIQVGPFTTHADADTMRQRLVADGYNAIIK
jgi:DedD protein